MKLNDVSDDKIFPHLPDGHNTTCCVTNIKTRHNHIRQLATYPERVPLVQSPGRGWQCYEQCWRCQRAAACRRSGTCDSSPGPASGPGCTAGLSACDTAGTAPVSLTGSRRCRRWPPTVQDLCTYRWCFPANIVHILDCWQLSATSQRQTMNRWYQYFPFLVYLLQGTSLIMPIYRWSRAAFDADCSNKDYLECRFFSREVCLKLLHPENQ